MISLIMATMVEAKPFVEGLSLREQDEKPFRVFTGKDMVLTVSGIGKGNGAMAGAVTLERFKPRCVVNLGAAGAVTRDFNIGDILHIEKVIEYDRVDIFSGQYVTYSPEVLSGFATGTLATQDRPVLEEAERDLISGSAQCVDMEGASILQACRLYGAPCCIFKFISDTPDHTEGIDIVRNIKTYRDRFFDYYRESIAHALPQLRQKENYSNP